MEIQQNERLDDLQYKGLKLLQKTDGYCFGIDAVLLADFVQIPEKSIVLDIGTGTGVIAVLIAAKKKAAKVVGLEIQSDISDMAARSVKLNGLEDIVHIVQGDVKDSVELFGVSAFDAVVSNPPYIEKGKGLLSTGEARAVSRHEIYCTLEDVIGAASKLLKPNGKFFIVHRPQRLADIIWFMRKYTIEPKLLRFIHPSQGKRPNLLLVKGIKGAGPELRILEPLCIYDEKGCYSREINEIYNRG